MCTMTRMTAEEHLVQNLQEIRRKSWIYFEETEMRIWKGIAGKLLL